MKTKAPSAPDPAETARAQTSSNVLTAIANAWIGATNQTGPGGSLKYTQTGTQRIGNDKDGWYDIPTFTAEQILGDAEKAQYDKTLGLENAMLDFGQGRLKTIDDTLSQPFNYDGLPELPQDMTKFREDQQNAMMSRFNQDWDKESEATRTRLANQGVGAGSEAWTDENQNLYRARNDASVNAYLNAGNAANQEFSRTQAARQQGITERHALRAQPINEMATLLGMGGEVAAPQFAPPINAQVQPTDVMGAYNLAYQGKMNAYNQKMGQQNAMLGGLFGLAGSGLGGWARNWGK